MIAQPSLDHPPPKQAKLKSVRVLRSGQLRAEAGRRGAVRCGARRALCAKSCHTAIPAPAVLGLLKQEQLVLALLVLISFSIMIFHYVSQMQPTLTKRLNFSLRSCWATVASSGVPSLRRHPYRAGVRKLCRPSSSAQWSRFGDKNLVPQPSKGFD